MTTRCRVKPRRPHQTAAGARTRQPENSKRAHFRAPALQTPPKFHERTPRERKKKENCGGRREKKREILALPPFWAPPFWAPPFGASTLRGPTLRSTLRGNYLSRPLFFWVWASTLGASTLWVAHPLWSKNSTSKHWPKSKLAEVEIGRSRTWPKSKLAEVELAELEKKAGRSRNWPKSITPALYSAPWARLVRE